jgi:ribosomal-protein-alanine N-acetyltransferase
MPAIFDFSAFPTLYTPRLCLREITLDDAEAIFAIRGDHAVTRHNIGPAYRDIERARLLIAEMRDAYAHMQELRWGITLPPDRQVVGMVGFNDWHRTDRRASVGYDLAQTYWGQGIMPEALGAVLAFGFRAMDLNRIEATVSAGNPASVRVLEKLGFVLEGRQREQYYDEERFCDLLLFGLLGREFDDANP